MNKAERAYQALNEAADALDDLPAGVRTQTLFGPMFDTRLLRKEATAIVRKVNTAAEALEDANYDTLKVHDS